MIGAKDIQKGSDVATNWRTTNQHNALIQHLSREAGVLREAVFRGRGRDGAMPNFPFRIYYLPNSMRAESDPEAWRTFYVQHGFTGNTKTDGCDDTDGEGTTPLEIVVPIEDEAVPKYYVWVEISLTGTLVTGAQIKHGIPADNGWTSYPDAAGDDGKMFIMVGWIDALSEGGIKKANVRQCLDRDIVILTAAGGDARWA